jgi:hypothetical protein
MMNIPRTGFLFWFAGALLRADDSPRNGMLLRSARPEDLENGGRYFEPRVPGVQWGNGAVGNHDPGWREPVARDRVIGTVHLTPLHLVDLNSETPP